MYWIGDQQQYNIDKAHVIFPKLLIGDMPLLTSTDLCCSNLCHICLYSNSRFEIWCSTTVIFWVPLILLQVESPFSYFGWILSYIVVDPFWDSRPQTGGSKRDISCLDVFSWDINKISNWFCISLDTDLYDLSSLLRSLERYPPIPCSMHNVGEFCGSLICPTQSGNL